MVVVYLCHNSHGDLVHIRCQGHAEFAEDGSDIVCAGVSALTGALALGITKVLKLPLEPRAAEGEFELDLSSLSGEMLKQASVLTRTFQLAVEQLEEVYRGFVEVRGQPAKEEEQL